MIEAWSGPQSYVVQGTGPYTVEWPYRAGAVGVTVIETDGRRTRLGAIDWGIQPAASNLTGAVTLTPAAAALHRGKLIILDRDTPIEQGWKGLLGEREKGLEVQLDQIVMALQEALRMGQSAVRVDGAVDPLQPVPGRVLMFDAAGQPMAGPNAMDILAAQAAAATAVQAAAQVVGEMMLAVGVPRYASRTEAAAALVPAPASYIIVGDLPYRRDPAGTALVTGDGGRWTAAGTTVIPQQFGASGDRTVDDGAALQSALARGLARLVTDHLTRSTLTAPAGGIVEGGGHLVEMMPLSRRDGIRVSDQARLRDVILDKGMAAGRIDGHGIVLTGSGSRVQGVTVRNFGTDDVAAGSGTGIISTSSVVSEGTRISDVILEAVADAALAFGWVLSNDRYSIVRDVFARKVSRYAHELKNNSRYNILYSLIAADSQAALSFGQQGGNGADRNVAFATLGANIDSGLIVGYGNENVIAAAGYHAGTSQLYPAYAPDGKIGIRLDNARRNVVSDQLLTGTYTYAVKLVAAQGNHVAFAGHHSGGFVRLEGGSERNVIEVQHPGPLTSVADAISAPGGMVYRGGSANVVDSPGTGERIGSISGRFHDKLGNSGATPTDAHWWWREGAEYNLAAIMSPGNAGDIAGETYYRLAEQVGRFWYVYGAARADDRYRMGVGGVHDVLVLAPHYVEASKPLRVPVHTVANAPSAAASGAGAQIYVSNGDSGRPCLAVSDGNSWLRVVLGTAVTA